MMDIDVWQGQRIIITQGVKMMKFISH